MAGNNQQEDMSFLQHLEVLRWHLIRSAGAIILFAIIAFVSKGFLFDTILFGPKSPDFFTFRVLCRFSNWLFNSAPSLISSADILCIGQEIPKLQNISMAGQFTTHIMVSLIAGLVISFPYISWEVWRFIKPGLRSEEVRHTRGVVFWTWLLFAVGILFGYYIISPLSVNFFASYSISSSVETLPTLTAYISTVTTVVLATGIVFELPILVYFLTKTGLVTPEFLKKYRKHATVAALILSAIITPPDVFSQVLVCIPLIFLYEVSIGISRRIIKREQR